MDHDFGCQKEDNHALRHKDIYFQTVFSRKTTHQKHVYMLSIYLSMYFSYVSVIQKQTNQVFVLRKEALAFKTIKLAEVILFYFLNFDHTNFTSLVLKNCTLPKPGPDPPKNRNDTMAKDVGYMKS